MKMDIEYMELIMTRTGGRSMKCITKLNDIKGAVIRVFVISLFVGIIVMGCARKEEYVPITREWRSGDPVLVVRPDLLTESHIKHFQAILDQYSYEYELKDGEIMIPRSLSNDRDLLSNLTEKALAREKQTKDNNH